MSLPVVNCFDRGNKGPGPLSSLIGDDAKHSGNGSDAHAGVGSFSRPHARLPAD